MLKQLSFSLLTSFRFANTRPPYSYGLSSVLPLCAYSLFLYRQAKGLLGSILPHKPPPPPPPPPHKLLTLIWHGQTILFFSVVLLILTACGGGSGGSSSSGGNGGGGSPQALEVKLTFAPIERGFQIGNQSDFGDMVSLNIEATSENGQVVERRNINIGQFVNGYDFTGLDDLSNYTFRDYRKS